MRHLLSPDGSDGGSTPRPDVQRGTDRITQGQSTSVDSIKTDPDAGGDNAPVAGQVRGDAGKAVGGGLEGDRSIEQNTGNGGGRDAGAIGNNVLNTGRPTAPDAPSGIGAAAISGANEAVQSEAGQRRPGGEISTDGT